MIPRLSRSQHRFNDRADVEDDFDAYERLVAAARETDWVTHLVVLLGGDAGLRCGEMMALEWRDVELSKRQLSVAGSEWKGHVAAPKGGRRWDVPLTSP